VRFGRLLATVLAAGLVSAHAPDVSAQFNPEGRSKKKKGGGKPTAPAKPAKPGAATKPATPATKPPVDADPGSGRPAGPSSEALIGRYLGVALAQPGADFPLQRLAELYRERDGKLDALITELERRAGDAAGRYNALVVLAGVYKLDGKPELAVRTYERAIAEKPNGAAALLSLGRLYDQQGDKAKARERLRAALPHVTDAAEQEMVLRSLVALSLELDDFDGAKKHHRELVNRAKGSFFVRAELGRELLNRGKYDRAAEEFREVVKAAAGDHRVLAPALRDLGVALARGGHKKEALAELEKALRVAGQTAGVRREVYQTIAEVYRADDRLAELLARLEKETALDADELRLLASLYEETGRIEKALATYRKVLTRETGDISTRLKVVQLLEVQGALDQAVGEYEALIRAAPRNPDYVFRLAEALIQRGERARAVQELTRLEARSGDDEQTLAALVDFYERVGERDKSLALLTRLAQSGASDPQHLVELGTRYWQAGDKKKAVATWQRLRVVVPDRAQALLMLGELYLEHDMAKEALDALNEAAKLQPKQARYKKAYALALERMGGAAPTREQRQSLHDEAYKIWEQLLRDPASNRELAREARQHIVTLWGLSGQLAARAGGLERRFNAKPPDLEAGRLLGEAYVRLQRYTDAERALRRVVEVAPGDIEALGRLERTLVLQRKLSQAIEVLEQLAKLEPKRAREHYQRMAEYASELYRDDDAIRFASRAVELSPDDADGHKKLGEMYRQRQDTGRAIAEFRQAIAKNERLFPVYLELAELLLGRGEVDDADQLLRRVARAAPDEELVLKAARLSMQVNLGRGTLESLERDLLPLALNNPERPLYRRLLVEVYGAMTYPLLHRSKSQDPVQAAEARVQLRKLGERAVKPLLDALSDPRDSQQVVAITLLMHVANPGAAPALFAYATSDAESSLRARAMLALGGLEDDKSLPRLSAWLAPDGDVRSDESDPVVLAAAYSVARLRAPAARGLLAGLLDSEAPSLRALGALGLGALGDKRSVKDLTRVARAQDAGPIARAAAAHALGALGARSEASVLAELADAPDGTLSAAALIALARVNGDGAADAIAEALVSPDAELRKAAGSAALVWTTGKYAAGGDELTLPEDRVDVRTLLAGLRPSGHTKGERVDALARLAPALGRATSAAAQSSPERARAVMGALGLGRTGSGLPELVVQDSPDLDDALLKKSRQVTGDLASKLVPAYVGLARHPASDERAMAIEFLGGRSEPAAQDAVIAALADREPGVRRAALLALPAGHSGAIAAVSHSLASEQDWALRSSAAEALGRIAARSSDAKATAALTSAASSDPYALVRERAAQALHAVNPAAARAVLERLSRSDEEPAVKSTALKLLSGAK
jgi:cellulose synthase operon protein C